MSTPSAGVIMAEKEEADTPMTTRSSSLRSKGKRNPKPTLMDPGTDLTGRSECEEEWTGIERRVSMVGSVRSSII